MHRKVIQITAKMSPNVRWALEQIARGEVPDGRILVPGVLSHSEYVQRRATWDRIRQSVGLDAEFWEGAELLLYPPDWLNRSERKEFKDRCQAFKTEAIGIDPGEGKASTAMAAINRWGLKELKSVKSKDTSLVPHDIISFGMRHGVPSSKWAIDRGGGGREHEDRLRGLGYPVIGVAFGSAPTPDPKRYKTLYKERLEAHVDRAVYANLRIEMYDGLSQLLDPSWEGFSLPEGIRGDIADPETELRHQLSPIPRTYKDGKMFLLPKNNPNDPDDERTLVKLIGHSPDEADALVLAVHALFSRPTQAVAGAFTEANSGQREREGVLVL